jgi:hypothetical protein
VEPHTSAKRLRWLEHNVEGLAHEVTSIRAQLRALVLRPPAFGGADQELAELLQRQLELMERQCALVRAQLAALRADLTGESLPELAAAADPVDAQEP